MTKTTLHIDGMMCDMCESHINEVIRKNFKVSKVKSSHKKGLSEIISEEPLDEKLLASAIRETGYDLQSIDSEPYVKKGLFGK